MQSWRDKEKMRGEVAGVTRVLGERERSLEKAGCTLSNTLLGVKPR